MKTKFTRNYAKKVFIRARKRRYLGRNKGLRKIISKVAKREIHRAAENKFSRSSTVGSIAAAAGTTVLGIVVYPNIAQGDGGANRQGNQIAIQKYRYQIKVFFASALYSMFRLVIAKPKLMQTVSDMDAEFNAIFPNTATPQNLNTNIEPSNVFNVLYDSGMMIKGGNESPHIVFKKTGFLPKQRITYKSNTDTYPTDRYPKAYFIYSNTVNSCSYMYNDVTVFEDE